jgi:hypothetical protein
MSGVSISMIKRLEAEGGDLGGRPVTGEKIVTALEKGQCRIPRRRAGCPDQAAKDEKETEMKRALTAIAVAAAFLPASSNAKDSTDIALALGTVLASEEFCGLNYDQAAIQEFIRKRVSPDDMDFPSSLESMTAGVRIENQTMSDSAKIAHCTQIARIAKSYGFTQGMRWF